MKACTLGKSQCLFSVVSPLVLVDIFKSSVLGLLTAPLLLGDDCLQYKRKYNRLVIINARRLRDRSAIRVMVSHFLMCHGQVYG